MYHILNTLTKMCLLGVFKPYLIYKTKKQYIKNNLECAVCKTTKMLEVHHVKPVHLFPLDSCDLNNMITLCRSCHFRWGHFRDFESDYNLDIRNFANCCNKEIEIFSNKIK